MSDEDKELLARIGQLAGQINRHKSQQAGPAPATHSAFYRRNTYRHTSAPYPRAGYRGGRASAPHRHRTLHLNNSKTASEADSSNDGTPSDTNWVSRNDRHRQLINANVYEKEAQNRSKAIEETRQRKLRHQRFREKSRFNDFLQRQAPASDVAANPESRANRNEIMIEGMRFRVMDGGKKLAKVMDDLHSAPATPKCATVAGVTFHRTKTGNLVANRVVQDHRRSGVVKKDEPCKIFSTTGSCPKGPSCRYQHDPTKVAVCKDFLKDGKCGRGESCDLSHELTAERVLNSPGAPVCKAFGFRGYCEKGAACTERHVFECPDFSNTGSCNNKGCKLLHRERASVLRTNAKADEEMEDVSSGDEPADSDDVDSDEVVDFIDADSDDSDFEKDMDFIPV
ncbi:Zinc finger CCCH domain-containing protein [Tolypocladium ophioglossoides CBS 100239]|uniref:Zinc finger CCCH domain-containing protein n=1 Tax=Tolypocladium ophioglossoides (strain CBS 100239) TaxID=1163406 RepID=A0A0L0NL75_TOLOC|nr:Zinc finger CCCH domain-containing protein [Tolypocladium ophioglossoides CBS 100239]